MRSLFGVRLEEGEKVYFYDELNAVAARITGVILGILMIPVVLIGLYMLYIVIFKHRQQVTYVYAVTNRRFLAIKGSGAHDEVRFQDLEGFLSVSGKSAGFYLRPKGRARMFFRGSFKRADGSSVDVPTLYNEITAGAQLPECRYKTTPGSVALDSA